MTVGIGMHIMVVMSQVFRCSVTPVDCLGIVQAQAHAKRAMVSYLWLLDPDFGRALKDGPPAVDDDTPPA